MKNILIYAILLYSLPQMIKAQSQTNICSSEKKQNQTMVNAVNWHCADMEGSLVFAIFTASLTARYGISAESTGFSIKPDFCFSVIK